MRNDQFRAGHCPGQVAEILASLRAGRLEDEVASLFDEVDQLSVESDSPSLHRAFCQIANPPVSRLPAILLDCNPVTPCDERGGSALFGGRLATCLGAQSGDRFGFQPCQPAKNQLIRLRVEAEGLVVQYLTRSFPINFFGLID